MAIANITKMVSINLDMPEGQARALQTGLEWLLFDDHHRGMSNQMRAELSDILDALKEAQ